MSKIKDVIGTDKVVLGADTTKKLLRRGSLKKIFLASNVSGSVKADFEKHAKISGVEIEMLDVSNDELGVMCKKLFPIVAIGMKK